MKIEENFEIIGYVYLYMKFWPVNAPNEEFYLTYRSDFGNPLTKDVLKTFLESCGKICEQQNKGVEFTGKYITKDEYETATAEDNKDGNNFVTDKFSFGDTNCLPDASTEFPKAILPEQ